MWWVAYNELGFILILQSGSSDVISRVLDLKHSNYTKKKLSPDYYFEKTISLMAGRPQHALQLDTASISFSFAGRNDHHEA